MLRPRLSAFLRWLLRWVDTVEALSKHLTLAGLDFLYNVDCGLLV
jgi:hypothetical protein